MACGADCLRDDWPFGVAGVCDNITNRCVCPEGYFGKDDWEEFNDCHIDKQTAAWAHVAGITANAILALCHLAGLLWTRRRFPSFQHLQASMVSAVLSLMKYSTVSQTDSKLKAGQISGYNSDMENTNTAITLAVFSLILYPYFSLLYTVPLALDPPVYPYELPVLQDLGQGMRAILLLVFGLLINLIWYSSLPDLRMLGQVFNLKNFLIRYPRLFPIVMYINITLVFVSLFTTGVVIPNLYSEDKSLRKQSMSWFVTLIIAIWAEDLIIITLLRIQFSSISSDIAANNNFGRTDYVERTLKRVKKTMSIWYFVTCVAVLPGIVFLAILAYSDFGARHKFLFLALLEVVAGIALLGSFLLLFSPLFKGEFRRESSFNSSGMISVRSNSYPEQMRNASLSHLGEEIVIHGI